MDCYLLYTFHLYHFVCITCVKLGICFFSNLSHLIFSLFRTQLPEVLTNSKRQDSILATLHWLPVSNTIDFNLLLITFKVSYDLADISNIVFLVTAEKM